jgi:MFS family permease
VSDIEAPVLQAGSAPEQAAASASRGTLRRDLDACTGDGATYCLMVGASETYFAAFALALGKGNVIGGLVSTIPNLAGSVLQLASPAGLRRLGSPRRWIQGCAVVQSCSLLALATGAFVGAMSTWLIFACLATYWASALGAGPAWNTWVAHLFPERLRARYFSARSRLCNLLQLAAILLAGAVLSWGERAQWPLPAFGAVLSAAACCRLSSIAFLQRQGDVPLEPEDVQPLAWRGLARRLLQGDLRILSFLACFQMALMSGGPFITPWLIDLLHMDKLRFTVCMAMVFVSKSLGMPLASRLIRRVGARRALAWGAVGTGLAIGALPLGTNLAWILLIQTVFGLSVSVVELGGFLMQLETLRHHERTSLMSMYMAMNCAGSAVGSLVGAGLLKVIGEGQAGFAAVFVVSGALRIAVLALRPARRHVTAVQVA